MDEDEPEYVDEEDLQEHDFQHSTAAYQAALVNAAQRPQQWLDNVSDEEEPFDEQEEDEDYGQQGAGGPVSQDVGDDFDPDAIEGILSGQNESTPIFNQLFGAVDYTNDDEAAVADEDLEELEAQMAFENAPSRKRRRQKQTKRYRGGRALTDEQSRLLGEANMAYTQGQYTEAIRCLHQIIRAAPHADQAWFTLAMIHEELEDSVKALQFYLIAAHLTPKDAELWKRLGDMSTNAAQYDQAIYCYNKAIRVNKADVDAITRRSSLYEKTGQYRKAIEGFTHVLRLNPDDLSTIKELAKLYLATRDPQRAIDLFEGVLAEDDAEFGNEPGIYVNFEPEEVDEDEEEAEQEAQWVSRRIQFEETNMLAELYMEVDDYEVAIDFIKKQTRRLQGRWTESPQWDAADNDDEYADDVEGSDRWLPLELRAKLGICRLWTDDLDLARQHFNILQRYPVEEYPELFYDVADAYIAKKMFEPAMEILDLLAAQPATDNDQTWSRQATCAKELGDLERTAKLLEKVLENKPGDVDVSLELAQVYTDLGDSEQAMRLVAEVEKAAEAPADGTGVSHAARALIAADTETVQRRSAVKEQVRREEEEQAQVVNKTNFQRCKVLWDKWNNGEASELDHADFLRSARKLVQKFQSTKAFYPSDRAKRFTGLTRRKRRSKNDTTGAQQALENLVTRLKRRNGAEEPQPQVAPNVTSFQGLDFDEWHDVFVMYAVALCRKHRTEEAQMILQTAIDANVFYHDEHRLMKLKVLSIAIALQSGDFVKVAETCRWLCNYKPYKTDPYRLYSACLAGGPDAVSAYAQASVQKAFQRLVRQLEAKAKKAPENPENHNAMLVCLYGHILLAARSYQPAIVAYLKAYQLNENDQLVNMSLGVALLHRAMNRQSDNRHLLIVQGLTFLFKYFDLKGGDEEACFNIGRAFHQLGLFHLAIPYYEKVLSAEEAQEDGETHKREAAYNLCAIYMATGSAPLAHMVMRKYCVV